MLGIRRPYLGTQEPDRNNLIEVKFCCLYLTFSARIEFNGDKRGPFNHETEKLLD